MVTTCGSGEEKRDLQKRCRQHGTVKNRHGGMPLLRRCHCWMVMGI